jgi:hypothetical protein
MDMLSRQPPPSPLFGQAPFPIRAITVHRKQEKGKDAVQISPFPHAPSPSILSTSPTILGKGVFYAMSGMWRGSSFRGGFLP